MAFGFGVSGKQIRRHAAQLAVDGLGVRRGQGPHHRIGKEPDLAFG